MIACCLCFYSKSMELITQSESALLTLSGNTSGNTMVAFFKKCVSWGFINPMNSKTLLMIILYLASSERSIRTVTFCAIELRLSTNCFGDLVKLFQSPRRVALNEYRS